ncbi:hypothetical protein GCM10027073_64030 [Streptomyces chlorus]|uniref:Transposase n=1 Tax=Streptomyces chlorus TaxID=887452 RepID=A0ABW1E8H3_9ACTN
MVSCETVRARCAAFGSVHATRLRRRRPRPGDERHPDEALIKVNGKTRYLWHTVVTPPPTIALRAHRRLRSRVLEDLPQPVRHQPLDHPRARSAS